MVTHHGLFYLFVCHHSDDPSLLGHILEHTEDFAIALDEAKLMVCQPTLGGKLFDEEARFTQVVSRQSREEMVCYLEVETTVDKTQRIGADNVCCSAELTSDE